MFEQLRSHLAELPVLAELLARAAATTPSHATNTEEQRFHLEQLHQAVMQELRAQQRPYVVILFPDQELLDPETRATVRGAYWELNHPVTGQSACLPHPLVRAFVERGVSHFSEAMRNVTGVRVGTMRSALDLGAMARVLAGGPLAPELRAELEAAQQQQASQLAQARGA